MEKRIKAYLLLTEEWLQGKDKLSEQERENFRQEYLVHLSFYQHERLVHLLVTILFAILNNPKGKISWQAFDSLKT